MKLFIISLTFLIFNFFSFKIVAKNKTINFKTGKVWSKLVKSDFKEMSGFEFDSTTLPLEIEVYLKSILNTDDISSGKAFIGFINNNVTDIVKGTCHGSVACVTQGSKVIALDRRTFQLYAEDNDSLRRLQRQATYVHEALHVEGSGKKHHDCVCPPKGHLETSHPYNNQVGVKTCDMGYMGAHGLDIIYSSMVAFRCINCDEGLRQFARRYSACKLELILDPESRKILESLFPREIEINNLCLSSS